MGWWKRFWGDTPSSASSGSQKEEMSLAMQFHEPEITVSKRPRPKPDRNNARIERIRAAMVGLDEGSEKYMLLKNELEWREAEKRAYELGGDR